MDESRPTIADRHADAGAADAHRRRSLFFLCLAVAGVGFAMAQQMGSNANFVVEEMHLSGRQQGGLEAFRESCGIISLGLLALMAGSAEPLIGAAMLVLLGLGLGAYSIVPSYPWLVLASLVWSQGLHVWMPLPNSMTLSLAEPGRTGRRLGQVQASGAAGSGAGLAAALILHLAGVHIRWFYVVACAAALLGAGACLGVPRKIKTPGPRLVFRRRYGLYYVLCFLEGWRKQIVIAFAGFLLVKEYQTPLTIMLLLAAGTNLVGWMISPVVGRLIDRLGERKMLVFYYVSLTVCFIGYAMVRNRWVLYAVFVIDSSFFAFAMALTTYVSRIAPAREHTPTLSMGVAMNHVAAVAMPFVGGLLWELGYHWTFLTGVCTAGLSILASLFVGRHVKGDRSAPAAREGLVEPVVSDGHLAESIELPMGIDGSTRHGEGRTQREK